MGVGRRGRVNRFFVYLLAAGHGRRAGGPKAWLEHDGKPLLARQLEFLLKRFPPGSIAVSIQKEWLERCKALDPRVVWVPTDPEAPAFASLKALMAALPFSKWAFLYHVDMPVWEDELFYLLSSFVPKPNTDSYEAIVPTHVGKGGHPVLLAPSLSTDLRGLDANTGRLDAFLKSRRVHRVDVPYPCVLENWNGGRQIHP